MNSIYSNSAGRKSNAGFNKGANSLSGAHSSRFNRAVNQNWATKRYGVQPPPQSPPDDITMRYGVEPPPLKPPEGDFIMRYGVEPPPEKPPITMKYGVEPPPEKPPVTIRYGVEPPPEKPPITMRYGVELPPKQDPGQDSEDGFDFDTSNLMKLFDRFESLFSSFISK